MRVVVFARAPIAGQVKTRLAPALGAAGAAELHRRLVRRTLRTAAAAGVGPLELCCTPDAGHGFFLDCAAEFGAALATQGEGDLGTRMARALARAAPALLVGTDCPALQADELVQAAAALGRHDVVLIPAEDGGYVLIGLGASRPALFENIEWGASDVLARTRKRIAAERCTALELAASWDVDRPADLERLATLDPALLEGLR
jgi:hypothetical protein